MAVDTLLAGDWPAVLCWVLWCRVLTVSGAPSLAAAARGEGAESLPLLSSSSCAQQLYCTVYTHAHLLCSPLDSLLSDQLQA